MLFRSCSYFPSICTGFGIYNFEAFKKIYEKVNFYKGHQPLEGVVYRVSLEIPNLKTKIYPGLVELLNTKEFDFFNAGGELMKIST